MNYDWKYDDRNGSDQFWRNFEFRFDNPELLHLRHGSRNAVIMGGDTWASGGHLESEHTEVAHLEIVAGSPPVEVLVRSKELFQFMEPVNVEIRLRNTSKKRLELDTDLDPEFGVVTLLVRGPDGFVHQYEPLMCKLAERSQMTLSTANKTQTGSDRYSQLVDVTFGKRGFYFDRPGQYAIRAIYQGVDGTLIPSALHYIRVGYPMTQDAERIAQDYFTHDVGLAIYLNGSQSKRMSNAMSTLREVVDRFPQQPIAAKVALVVASAIGRPFFKLKAGKLQKESAADPKEALSITDTAIETYASSKNAANNLPYRSLVEQRASYWAAIDDSAQANFEIKELSKTLKDRGVNSSVIMGLKETI